MVPNELAIRSFSSVPEIGSWVRGLALDRFRVIPNTDGDLYRLCNAARKVMGPTIAMPGQAEGTRIRHVDGFQHQRTTTPGQQDTATQRGQSLVEFGLVVSLLLVLVVAVADFGRVFAAGLVLETAARDGAEVAANEYLAEPPGPLNAAAPSPPDAAYYDRLHQLAARTACTEVRELANTTYDPLLNQCPGMPLTVVCVHDGQDPGCANEANGATIPAECSELQTASTNASLNGTSRYVEVRLCYRFDSIVDVPLVSFGTFWLERTRMFIIPCYFVLGNDECG